jgi:hypothetical protein
MLTRKAVISPFPFPVLALLCINSEKVDRLANLNRKHAWKPHPNYLVYLLARQHWSIDA